MRYDPEKHHRRSIRLRGYDYSRPGAYFVTICVKNRECLLGEIRGGKMILNDFGKIIDYHWREIPTHFQNVKLDEFVVMPNHFHAVLWLVGGVGDGDGVGAKHSGQPLSSEHDVVAGNASPLHRHNRHNHRHNHHNHRHHHPNRPAGTKPGSLSAIIQNFTSITSRKMNRIRKTPGKNYGSEIFMTTSSATTGNYSISGNTSLTIPQNGNWIKTTRLIGKQKNDR